MKFELVVLQNGAEGKRIPLASPVFKIGRGETCNLRPNSERVSREHAEFAIKDDTLQVRDLGSRNGTLVNGKPISESAVLARGDQVTVGPLTFAIAIEGSTVPEVKKTAVVEEKPKSGSPADEIAALLLGGDEKKIASEAPSVYSGETITIAAFRAGESQIPASSGITEAAKMDDQGFERQTEESDGESGEEEEVEDEFVDESNPFYQKKPKEQPVVEGPKKEMYKDTADAASAILRKLMERKSDD
jgi:pSer/pThr/pTyr-binding forkhead associated (FHA) protein